MKTPKKLMLLALMFGGAMLAFMLPAQKQASKLESSSQLSQTLPQSASAQAKTGRMAYIDPVTGELTSTPPVGQPKLPQAQQSVGTLPPVQFITHTDGTVQAKLNGRFRSPLMATVGCDGQLALEHAKQADVESRLQQARSCDN